MKRCWITAALLALACAGCAQHFTHARFETIRNGADSRANVRELLGEPRFDAGDQWYYEDLDRHLSALIYFGADGRVSGKEWIDGGEDDFGSAGGRSGVRPAGDTTAGTVRTRRGGGE